MEPQSSEAKGDHASPSSIRKCARAARSFLRHPPGQNATLWVFVEGRKAGCDVARIMAKEEGHSRAEIPEDTLPIFAGYNAENGAAVFILRGRGDVHTVQVTMQGTLGEHRQRQVEKNESRLVQTSFGTEWEAGTSQLVDAQGQSLSKRFPDTVLLDQKKPDWKLLSEFVKDETTVHLTGRVEDREPAG